MATELPPLYPGLWWKSWPGVGSPGRWLPSPSPAALGILCENLSALQSLKWEQKAGVLVRGDLCGFSCKAGVFSGVRAEREHLNSGQRKG